MFDEEEDHQNKKGEDLQINEAFAKRFEHNKRRELLDKAKEKYGEKALLGDDDGSDAESSSSSSNDEDEDANLLNPKLERKFLETLALIRENNPKLMEMKGEVFQDSDFEDDEMDAKKEKRSKPVTYKDLIREDILANRNVSGSESEEEMESQRKRRRSSDVFSKKNKNKETIHEEEQRLKKEFKQAAEEESEDEGFIQKKEQDDEEEVDEQLEKIEEMKLEQILSKGKKKKEMMLVTDVDLLKRFYGDNSNLDQADKFLRNYILLEGWKDKGKRKNQMEDIDKEDQDRDEEMDVFEHQYNFRYEEQTGAYLTTHAREVPESMRRKDDHRKEVRDSKKERKDDEKRRKNEELNKLKSLKKDEIMEKLKKAEFISGGRILEDKRILEKAEKELKTEFIPDLYDRNMSKMFDEKYYEMSDSEIKKSEKKKGLNLKLLKDKVGINEESKSENGNDNEDEEEEDDEQEREIYERELTKSLKNQVDTEMQGYDAWYVCDGCTKPIDGGKFRFDCNQCDNFTFCEKCYRKNKTHLHKFSKVKVPASNRPPENHDELIEKAYMLCHDCKDSLLDMSKRVFICKECSGEFDKGDLVYFCLKCKTKGTHEHKLEKLKGVPGEPVNLKNKEKDQMTEEEKGQYLENLLDEYYNLEYEDIIGGGQVKTRFNYKKVNAKDYGLTEDEILLLDDKQLNRMVSLKKYRAYIDKDEEDNVNIHRLINIKKDFKGELDEKRRMLKQALVSNVEQEKEKLLKTKKGDDKDKKHKYESKQKHTKTESGGLSPNSKLQQDKVLLQRKYQDFLTKQFKDKPTTPRQQYYSVIKQHQSSYSSLKKEKPQEKNDKEEQAVEQIIVNLRKSIAQSQEKGLDSRELKKITGSLNPIINGAYKTVNLQAVALMMYQLMQSSIQVVQQRELEIGKLNAHIDRYQKQELDYKKQRETEQGEVTQIVTKLQIDEEHLRKQISDLIKEKGDILNKLEYSHHSNKNKAQQNEQYIEDLRAKFLSSFELRLKDIEIEKNRELQQCVDKYEKQMVIFKKSCEDLIRDQLHSYIDAAERLRQILAKMQIKLVEDISPTGMPNLDDLENFLDGLVSVSKRKDIEIFDLRSKLQLEIEKCNKIEIDKLEYEQKAQLLKKQILAQSDKMIQDFSQSTANGSSIEATIGKLDKYFAFVKRSLTLMINDSEGSFRDSHNYQHEDGDDNENFDMSGNYSQLSDDEDLQTQIVQKYQREQQQNYTEEDDNESENQDHVNEMSFNKHNNDQEEDEYEQEQDHDEDEQENEGEEEDEDDDEEDEGHDQEMGDMKAKFDKIMANFIEDQKKQTLPKREAERSNAPDINDYKNKNLENNMKGIFKNIVSQQKQEDRQQEYEEPIDATVEGPNSDYNEQSVNIRINNKKLFPEMPKSKPPISAKVQIKSNGSNQQEERALTPDREQNMRDNIRNRLDRQQRPASGGQYQRPKSAKVVPQKQNLAKRPQTAKYVENKENDQLEDNKGIKVKKPLVPKQLIRPMTAVTTSSSKSTLLKKVAPKSGNRKKSDPVSRFQNMSNEWQRSRFLKGNSNKEGRKLDLDRFHRWSTLVQAHSASTCQKKGQVHKFIQNQKAPTDDRRDDLRFQLRAKISQKDYVNKEMKYFHYQQDMKTPLQNALKDPEVGEAANKLEQLKKQINHLRKCVE